MGEYDEFIDDFLVECGENLDLLRTELVALLETPSDEDRVVSTFRAFHTIKGSSGFLGYTKTHSLALAGEILFGQVRDGARPYDPEIKEVLMKVVDTISVLRDNVANNNCEGDADYQCLLDELDAMSDRSEDSE